MDRPEAKGGVDAPARFTAVTMTIKGDYLEGTEFEKLVTIAKRGCISVNTLKKPLTCRLRSSSTFKSAQVPFDPCLSP